MDSYKKGDRVKVSFYNVEYEATVIRDQASSIVWVTFDGETKERWFHAESLTRI